MTKKWPSYLYRIILLLSFIVNIHMYSVRVTQDKVFDSSIITFVIHVFIILLLWGLTGIVYNKRILRIICILIVLIICIMAFQHGSMTKLMLLPLMYLILTEVMTLLDKDSFRHKATLAILILVIGLIPVKQEPIDWSWVFKLAHRVETVVEEAAYRLKESLSDDNVQIESVGYGDMASVNDEVDVAGSDRIDLYLDHANKSEQIYLLGSSFMNWSDNTWSDKAAQEFDGRSMVLFLNLLYMNDCDRQTAECFSSIMSENIEYGLIRTKDIMHPDHVMVYEPESRDNALTDEGRLSEPAREGYKYHLVYMDIDEGSRYLTDMIRNYDTDHTLTDYDTVSEYFENVYGADLDQYIKRDVYDEVAKNINDGLLYDGYPAEAFLSDEPSVQIKELALKVTEGKKSDYDKACAIEEYLRKYEYSTTVSPWDGDKIEQFLFYNQKGYCVHFASAMTRMLRSIGIPARYCEGYNASLKYRDSNGKYRIHPTGAHAWTQVYIDGYGWMTFEPTPIKASQNELSWGFLTIADQQKYGYDTANDDALNNEKTDLLPEDVANADRDLKEKEKRIETIKRAVIVAAIIAAYLLLILLIRLLYLNIKYQRLGYTDRALYHINRAANLIKKRLKIKEKGITMRDIFNAANEAGGDTDQTILDDYYEMRFGGRVINKSEIARFRSFYRSVKRTKFSPVS